MIKVLVNAYACSPNMGSEPGMAWNWCINLASYCELHIITEGEFKANIEDALKTLPQAKNMHFYYNPVSDKVRKMCWNQGDWRFYKYYRDWQYQTYLIAEKIVQDNQIDILHQLNMIGFREPGYLWKIKNIPFVWGPVDAKEKFPTSFLTQSTVTNKAKQYLKNYITQLQLKYSGRVLKAVNRASVVIGASSESVATFHKYFNKNAILLNETGCYVMPDIERKCVGNDDRLKLLWVGKFDFRKQLELALKILAILPSENFELHIAGGSEDENSRYKAIASSLGIEANCIWHGKLPHKAIQSLMVDVDIFLFTSIAEGTPHVVLEAITNQLPVICFDCCGQGDSVNEKIGVKITLTTPSNAINDFATKLNYLSQNRNILRQMSFNCKERQRELSWDSKALAMVKIYNDYLKGIKKTS